MLAQSVGDIGARFIDILERCHAAVGDPGIPTSDALPPHFRGTLGHFPPYSPEEIVHTAALLSVSILIGGNPIEMRHAGSCVA